MLPSNMYIKCAYVVWRLSDALRDGKYDMQGGVLRDDAHGNNQSSLHGTNHSK